MTASWHTFAALLEAFSESEGLGQRVAKVLSALPQEVLQDFLGDPRFRISMLGPDLSQGQPTLLAFPAADGRGSRCVVLKQRLADCWEPYGLYVIAHELAHAYLHNGTWGDIDDPEEAADALAERWGFPRPASPFG
jgi:hypothetical protein